MYIKFSLFILIHSFIFLLNFCQIFSRYHANEISLFYAPFRIKLIHNFQSTSCISIYTISQFVDLFFLKFHSSLFIWIPLELTHAHKLTTPQQRSKQREVNKIDNDVESKNRSIPCFGTREKKRNPAPSLERGKCHVHLLSFFSPTQRPMVLDHPSFDVPFFVFPCSYA